MVVFAIAFGVKEGTGANAVSVVASTFAGMSSLLAASALKRGFTTMEATLPGATMVASSSFPQKAPSAMEVHSSAMATLAPMPAGAAINVRISLV
ncbi:hypothetical protein [Adlercreutzia murintestinalis]|uniref:hypothetical protein n=1 Tax=Adlercreutzia murintestinalis TaxID=2941325 RepID=UPI00203D0F90|nr:hypothetical protein [Adlercreutzia murintestinalis]